MNTTTRRELLKGLGTTLGLIGFGEGFSWFSKLCAPKPGVGVSRTVYSYTRGQLVLLRSCIEHNEGSLASALSVFFLTANLRPSAQQVVELWLRMAERVKEDPQWIERAFDQNNLTSVTVSTYSKVLPLRA